MSTKPAPMPLKADFDYYLSHQAELVEQFDGRYVVIKDGAVLGAYSDALSAVSQTQKHHVLGTFLVQKVTRGISAHTESFHSRVAF